MTPCPRVFMVGCGRSGTTVLYNTLAAHADTAWFSRWTDSTRRPELAAAAGLYRRLFPRAERRARRFLPYPSEGYRLWDTALALNAADALRPLTHADVTVAQARVVDELVRAHLRYGRAQCFINKNTRNSRRLSFLGSLYPEAVFVHVIRHPLDVVSSLTEIAWWPDVALWTRNGQSPRSLQAQGTEWAELAAELWVAETSLVRQELEQLVAPDRCIEIRYEDFVVKPAVEVATLLDKLGLAPDAGTDRFCNLISAKSVGTWRRRLSAGQLQTAVPIVSGLAGELGYETR